MSITTKNLYTLVVEEINKRVAEGSAASSVTSYGRQTEMFGASTLGASANSKEILSALYSILQEVLPQNIVEGLEVTATVPESDSVVVSPGRGSCGGNLYEITTETTIKVPLVNNIKVWYVVVYEDKVSIEAYPAQAALKLAKIIVPVPGVTNTIYDVSQNSWDGYIQSFKEYRLYGFNDRFEEDTIELLRDNIGAVLADNLIGNIRLSENLKVTNTAGTIELNSDSLKLYDFNGNVLAKLVSSGIYFYNASGVELAKFTTTGAHIGDMLVTPTSIQSRNFVAGSSGFQIRNDGNVEFNNMEIRGAIYATSGEVGGWTIASNMLYATTTGTIKTSATAGAGYNGVVIDKDGLRVYDSVLGEVVNLPSDGSAPTFSSGVISSVIFEINTNSVLRTSETVGDGTANSSGLLINSTGIYGCEANQTLNDANFKVLADGNAYFKGEIQASSGVIGGLSIGANSLSGGEISGTLVRSAIIETSSSLPRIRIDELGVYYQVIANAGKYGQFKYGDGTHYGAGVLAFLFNENYPTFAVVADHDLADIRLFNRSTDPASGSHELGDLICVGGELKICSAAGSPGTFSRVSGVIETRTSEPADPVTGRIWLRTDL